MPDTLTREEIERYRLWRINGVPLTVEQQDALLAHIDALTAAVELFAEVQNKASWDAVLAILRGES